MMNEIVEKVEIDMDLINFNGPEDDSDDFDGDDFDLEDIDSSVGTFDDFDDDEDF